MTEARHPARRRALAALVALPALAPAARLLAAPTASAAPLLQLFGRLRARPMRLFAAGPPAAVLLACLAPERLLGWPAAPSEAARRWLPESLRDKPALGRLSGRGSTVSVEALLALQPDLIVDAGSVDATQASTARRVAEQTGLPCLLIDGRLADSPRQLRELGRLLGTEARAQALAEYAEQALALPARSATARRPGVYLARGADGLETATAGAINAEIIEAAGGRNVADTGHAGVARVSLEQVLAWAPDWVLTQDRQFHRLAMTDTRWRSLAALREGRLLLAPDRPFGWLDGPPALNRLLGLRWLAMRLAQPAPVDAANAQVLDEAQRFYRLFYGLNPGRAALQGLLHGDA